MKRDWIPVKERLPKELDMLCLFIQWHDEWQTVINEYCGRYESVVNFREYELKNSYTHWMPLKKPVL